jgi:hypothetical protein
MVCTASASMQEHGRKPYVRSMILCAMEIVAVRRSHYCKERMMTGLRFKRKKKKRNDDLEHAATLILLITTTTSLISRST